MTGQLGLDARACTQPAKVGSTALAPCKRRLRQTTRAKLAHQRLDSRRRQDSAPAPITFRPVLDHFRS
jgi:hypothetical protein